MRKPKDWKKIILKTLAITLLVGIIVITGYAIFSILLFKGIENTIRALGIAILLNFLAIILTIEYKLWKKKCIKFFSIFFAISVIYMGGVFFAANALSKVYSTIVDVTESSVRTFSASIVVKSDSKYQNLNDAKKGKIGVLEDGILDGEAAIEGQEIPNQVLEEHSFNRNNIVRFEDYTDILSALLDGEIDSAFLPTRYVLMFSSIEEFEDIEKTTRIIHTESFDKEEKTTTAQKSLDEPFTVLIMGVDSAGDNLPASFNGDALMLLTFNPNTLNTTVVSIPRDSYMPISCLGNRNNKITHAGVGGDSCFLKTIENYFGITIDYYLKLNFSATVAFIDAIGGVEVAVPHAFCEQDSKRRWGKHTVYVEKGKRTLNGEQALAYMRKRKVSNAARRTCDSKYLQNAGYWNDFVRGQSQQAVLTAAINKMAKEVRSFKTIEDILNTIGSNSKTNMNVNTILSLYNLGKDSISKINNQGKSFDMQRLYLSGYDAYIYDYSFTHNRGTKLNLYNYVIYDESLEAVVNAMKENLGIKESTIAKSFSFSIKNEYTQTVIGKGYFSKTSLVRMPNLVGKNLMNAQTMANNFGINLVINYVDGVSGQFIGQVISQSIPELTDLTFVSGKTVTINVVNNIPSSIPEPEPDPNPENPDPENPEHENPDTGLDPELEP